jgi:hypothetical protein
VHWAEEHFARLNETLNAFFSNAYQFMVQDDPETAHRCVDMLITQELPDSIP